MLNVRQIIAGLMLDKHNMNVKKKFKKCWMFNKILKSALKKVNAKKIIILGNLKISRDVDYVYKFIYNVT